MDYTQSRSLLPSVFKSMSASYKAYWFIGLLECLNEDGLSEIPIKRICARMLVNAWYPVHFFKLHFGLQDLISRHNLLIKDRLNIDADVNKERLLQILIESDDLEVNNWIIHFQRQVTFRFLSPWIKYTSDSDVERASQEFLGNAPYSIDRVKGIISINPDWKNYLSNNYAILKDYGYWQLAQYLQTKNPGIPDIINKLIKPANRGSLSKQRNYWNLVFERVNSLKCIYTGEDLFTPNYAVEHYIPWSFTAHNLMWNLVPASSSINSSKSNRLPHASFLKLFVSLQKSGLETVYQVNPNHMLLEDYAIFGMSAPELLRISDEKFYDLYDNHITPQIQLARQLGFQDWDYKI